MKFVNLTDDHVVVIYNAKMGAQEVHIHNTGIARVSSKLVKLAEVVDDDSGMPIRLIAFTEHETYGLPEPIDGTIFIVSKAVREANPERYDLASPDVTAQEAVAVGGIVKSVPGLVMNIRRK